MDRDAVQPVAAVAQPKQAGPAQRSLFQLGTSAAEARPAARRAQSFDERLEELLPGDPRLWSQDEKDIFAARLCGMLCEDAQETFASHQERDARCDLIFRDDEDRQDFVATLGWVCGYWRGTVPFELAMKVCGINPRTVREAVMEAYARDLDLAQEIFADRFSLH